MKYGRFFNDLENRSRMPVVVIGEDVASNLFPNIDPTGKWIEVNGKQMEVGRCNEAPGRFHAGRDDLRVLLPYFTMRKMFPSAREHMILVSAKPGLLRGGDG